MQEKGKKQTLFAKAKANPEYGVVNRQPAQQNNGCSPDPYVRYHGPDTPGCRSKKQHPGE